MMNLLHKFLLAFILMITSCSQIKYVDIQVLTPAEITSDTPIEQLTILHAVYSAKGFIVGVDTSKINLFFNTLCDSIQSKLKASPALYDANINVATFSEYKKQFTKTSFSSRKNYYTIKLDSISLADSIFTDYGFFFDEDGVFNKQKLGVHQIIYVMRFLFRNVAFDQMTNSILLKDTIRWEYPISEISTNLDPVRKAKTNHYKEFANIIAMDLSEKLVPGWNMAERQIYFVPNQLMRKAYKHFVANDLDAAISQWNTVYNKGTRPLASKAAFNIALSYEIKDDLPASKDWLDKAIILKKDSLFIKYQQVVEKRIEERSKIDKQLWK
ncbi:MAG TPA: DUF6340 family protein [Bacteroidales bacterium]|nr:DUF6340 family protein [Bacteroidales bacterium]